MADFKIPNLNMNSDKYIFKKKLSLRRKSKRRLLTESALMFILSLILVYINYLIPNKIMLLRNLPANFNRSYSLIIDLCSNIINILMVVLIFISLFTALILFIGSLYRLFKIYRRKSKQVTY